MVDLISTILTSAGYTTKIATVNTWRETDVAEPACVICPSGNARLKWMAFGRKNKTQMADVHYIHPNNLDPTVSSDVDQFKLDMAQLFHCEVLENGAFAGTGVWKSEVEDRDDFDTKVPSGWNVSTARVKMDFVIGN